MKYRMLILNIATATAILYACNKNKLNEPALGLVDETTLANKNGVAGLLIGAYALLDGVTGDGNGFYGVGFWGSAASNWIYGSICGSEAYTGSYVNDPSVPPINLFAKFTFTPTGDGGGYLDGKWNAVYAGIGRANAVLRTMRLAKDISPDDTVQIHAEAVFLRAFYHFEAVKIWNKVPFVDESITYNARNYYPNNDTLIWPAIENDFRYGMDHLKIKQSSVGRANKYAAEAFLAKVYLFEGKYKEAKPLLEELISSGVTAGGVPYKLGNYKDNFDAEQKNGSEAVFSVQTSVNDGGSGGNGNFGDVLNYPWLGGPGGCCGFFQPSQWLVNHFKTDTEGLPDLLHFNDNSVKSDEGYESDSLYTPYQGMLDPRLDWTVGRRGVPYLDWGPHPGKDGWIRDQNYMGPYTPKKNSYKRSQAGTYSNSEGNYWALGSNANNVNLIRFADILLWAAEVEVETGGDLNKARDYVNEVRQRAADPSGWVTNEDNKPFAKAVTNSQAEFDVINASSDIQPFEWVVRNDLNQTWVLIKVDPDGTKVWNGYDPPHYKIGLYNNPWTDLTYARQAVRFERVLELGMEGHRFFDLVRWKIAEEEIKTYFQKEQTRRDFLKGASFTKGKNEYFPIPQDQINLSIDPKGVQHLKQNPMY